MMSEAGLRGRRVLTLAGAALGAALLVLLLLVSLFGARLDAPTIALAAAGAALMYALGQLYAMVWALSRPDRVAQVGQAAGSFTQAELRDEKRRLLRAIKELEFDFGMGKLSQADHDAVIATYRLRAIEVMRALEGGVSLHPELARLLAEREAAAARSSAAPAESPAAQTRASDVAQTGAPDAAQTGSSAAVPVADAVLVGSSGFVLSPTESTRGSFDETTRLCGACGATNDADARFCKLCGAAMKRSGGGAPRPAQAPRAGEIGEIGGGAA